MHRLLLWDVCYQTIKEVEEKNANDEVDDKNGGDARGRTINIVTNRWINVVISLSGRIHIKLSPSIPSVHKGRVFPYTRESLVFCGAREHAAGANACIVASWYGLCELFEV